MNLPVFSISGAVWRSKYRGLNTEDEHKLRNVPKEPGWYWARKDNTSKVYTHIVEVAGSPPWLTIGGVFVGDGNEGLRSTSPERLFWGPRVEIPEPTFHVLE